VKHARWIGLFAGVALAVVDTYAARALGVTFEIGGRDASMAVLVYLAASFAAFGFMVGYLLELRRRERAASALVTSQMATLRDLQERLAQNEKLASLGQLASVIAHEVRNPLAVIRSSVQNLEEGLAEDDMESRQSCAFVTEEIDRLSRVTSTLLGFARPLQLDAERVAPEELFRRVRLLSTRLLEGRNVCLECDLAGELPWVEVDPDLACQVLLGLLGNAAEVTPAGGTVRLEARARNDSVEIAVCDAGPGVPEGLRARIFEPFFTTRDEGTGLGLAVAKQIVEAHGSRIEVEDVPGGGARFAMSFRASSRKSAA
jgi:signal transduction histidine kinase